MEGELIYVAIIMQLGMILTIYVFSNLSLKKYFAKENFKTDLANVRATNKLNLKKLERDFGFKGGASSFPSSTPTSSVISQLSQLAPLIKNLDGEQIVGLIDKFTEGGGDLLETDEQGGGILDAIPQKLIDSFMGGLKEGGTDGTQEQTEGQSQVP